MLQGRSINQVKRCCLAAEDGISLCEVNMAAPKNAMTRINFEEEAAMSLSQSPTILKDEKAVGSIIRIL